MTQQEGRVFIIYADDDPDDHLILSEAIKSTSLQCELKSVYNGEELIQYLEENAVITQPTFVVVDINMPKVDGFSAIKHIKTKLKMDSLPIYTLSTSSSDLDKQKASALGVSGFYTKPDRTSDLKNIIKEMVLETRKFLKR